MGARDLLRALSAALLATLAGAPAFGSQDPAPAAGPAVGLEAGPEALPRARLERHLRAVYLERRLDFERRWDVADAPARARARSVLETLPGEAAFTPSARVLARAARSLDGGAETDEPDARERAVQLADSIDLRTLPGAFEPSDRRRGEPMVVVVRGLYPAAPGPAEQRELVLVWLGPLGEEIPAGGETVHPRALALGFEVYVHAPASRPAAWRLEPRIGAARGYSVPVECIANVRSRYAAHTAPGRALVEAVEHGIRPLSGTSITSMLTGVEPAPIGRALRDQEGSPAGYELDAGDVGAAGAVLMLETPRFEEPEWSFAGERGEAWRALARGVGCRVIAAASPASVAESLPDGQKTLVVRGAARALDSAFDRWVVLTRAGDAVLERGERPTLVVELGSDEQGVQGPEDEFTVVRLTDPPALADVVVPRWIARWLSGELPPAAGGDR